MIEINTIPADRWAELRPILKGEFDSALPVPQFASIVGAVEGDELTGFLVVEKLIRPGMLYVAPAFRNRHIARDLLRYFERRIPTGASVVIISREPKLDRFCEMKRMASMDGKLYRRDY